MQSFGASIFRGETGTGQGAYVWRAMSQRGRILADCRSVVRKTRLLIQIRQIALFMLIK
jgi:hypothetical protein